MENKKLILLISEALAILTSGIPKLSEKYRVLVKDPKDSVYYLATITKVSNGKVTLDYDDKHTKNNVLPEQSELFIAKGKPDKHPKLILDNEVYKHITSFFNKPKPEWLKPKDTHEKIDTLKKGHNKECDFNEMAKVSPREEREKLERKKDEERWANRSEKEKKWLQDFHDSIKKEVEEREKQKQDFEDSLSDDYKKKRKEAQLEEYKRRMDYSKHLVDTKEEREKQIEKINDNYEQLQVKEDSKNGGSETVRRILKSAEKIGIDIKPYLHLDKVYTVPGEAYMAIQPLILKCKKVLTQQEKEWKLKNTGKYVEPKRKYGKPDKYGFSRY